MEPSESNERRSQSARQARELMERQPLMRMVATLTAMLMVLTVPTMVLTMVLTMVPTSRAMLMATISRTAMLMSTECL